MVMRFVGNFVWLLTIGFYVTVFNILLGILLSLTVIGIPAGKQCFKYARLSVWPFGTIVRLRFIKHPISNIIHLVLLGFIQILFFSLVGILLCLTLFGIPFGIQCFKFAKLSAAPYGAYVY